MLTTKVKCCTFNTMTLSFAVFLDTAVYQLQVYIWEPESRSPGAMSEQLPTFSSPRHTRHLSGIADRLPHSQPHVHDGAQVRRDGGLLHCIHTFTLILTTFSGAFMTIFLPLTAAVKH